SLCRRDLVGVGRGAQLVEVGLGGGYLALGNMDTVHLGRSRGVVAHLRLLKRRLGAVHCRLRLHIYIVVLLPLPIVQLGMDALACHGVADCAGVSAGTLRIVPVLLGSGVARLGLGQRAGSLLHLELGVSLGRRELVALSFELSLGLGKLSLGDLKIAAF